MTWFRRLLARFRRRRRISAARAVRAPLREFVYLDEVSVYSLLASRQGALAAEYTDTRTNTTRSELASKLAGSGGVIKSEVSSKLEESATLSMQTLRKSTVQAAFKEFYEGEEERLLLSPRSREARPPKPKDANDFGQPEFHGWTIKETDLTRGALVEVEVQLQTHRLFKVSSIMTALWGILNDNPELFHDESQSQLKQFAAINRVLETLLVGLIPVECKAVDYEVMSVGGMSFIVHKSAVAQLSPERLPATHPLYIVGVTEERLFWKDVRRLLFANSRFRVLCRLNHNGLRESWVPVKLLDVVGDVVPNLADSLELLGELALAPPVAALDPTNAESFKRVGAALSRYGRLLADHYGVDLDQSLELVATEIAAHHHADFAGYDSRLAAFNKVVLHLSTTAGIEVEPVVAARFRSVALTDAAIALDGTMSSVPSDTVGAADDGKVFLDTEVVAIYW